MAALRSQALRWCECDGRAVGEGDYWAGVWAGRCKGETWERRVRALLAAGCCLQSLHPGWVALPEPACNACACRSLHPSPVPVPASEKTNYNRTTRRPWLKAPALIRVNCSLHDPSARPDRRAPSAEQTVSRPCFFRDHPPGAESTGIRVCTAATA